MQWNVLVPIKYYIFYVVADKEFVEECIMLVKEMALNVKGCKHC